MPDVNSVVNNVPTPTTLVEAVGLMLPVNTDDLATNTANISFHAELSPAILAASAWVVAPALVTTSKFSAWNVPTWLLKYRLPAASPPAQVPLVTTT